ncbi:MAG: ferredoxin--NADP reductase [Magnetococcus sp. WYHC-3]
MSAESRPESLNATLVARRDINATLTILRIQPDVQPYPFSAGQFAVLGLPRSHPRVAEADPEDPPTPQQADRLVRRAYSISSASQEQGSLEFYVRLVVSGELTPRLFTLQPGQRLFLGPKAAGVFTLTQVPPGQNILLVATGTGVAPYVSMTRTLAMGDGCPACPMTVIQGARHASELGFRQEMEDLARACRNFRYHPILSRPQDERSWAGLTGHLTQWLAPNVLDELAGFAVTPADTHIFLCGHPGMVGDASALFTARGFHAGTRQSPGNLHMEKYW